MNGAETYEPAFDLGDRVHVCDPIHEIPYEQGEVEEIDSIELLYRVRTDSGEVLGPIPEHLLAEVEGGDEW